MYITRSNLKFYGQTLIQESYIGNREFSFETQLECCDQTSSLLPLSTEVLITDNVPASVAGSNDASGTVRVHGTNVSLYNLNIANTYGKPVDQSQAIALSVQAGQFGCYGCKLTGYQDTLLANKGTQFYGKSYIEGYVSDYIHTSVPYFNTLTT